MRPDRRRTPPRVLARRVGMDYYGEEHVPRGAPLVLGEGETVRAEWLEV